MPSRVKGKFMPTFLGGSDVAVPVTSKNKALVRLDPHLHEQLGDADARTVGKQILNTTTLASINAENPQLAPFANASKSSWFVPTAPNWVKVENACCRSRAGNVSGSRSRWRRTPVPGSRRS